MKNYPKVIYKETAESDTDYSEEIDNIFKKIAKNEPKKILELRKQQILNHSKCHFIVDIFNDLANLIGQPADRIAELRAENCQEQLILLHSPVYLTVPFNVEPFHKWETWTFEELYAKYFDLVMCKGGEDF